MVSTANPELRLSGGIGGKLLELLGPGYQEGLKWLKEQIAGTRPLLPGSIVASWVRAHGIEAVLHVVSLDVFYKTTPDVLLGCAHDALLAAQAMGARSVSLPALATGYGRVPYPQCARAVRAGLEAALPRLVCLERIEFWLPDDARRREFETAFHARANAG